MRRRIWIWWLSLAAVLAVTAQLGLRWNASPSVAPGLYLKRQQPAERGDLVLVCLPETSLSGCWEAAER